MKRVIVILLCLAMLVLSACGKDNGRVANDSKEVVKAEEQEQSDDTQSEMTTDTGDDTEKQESTKQEDSGRGAEKQEVNAKQEDNIKHDVAQNQGGNANKDAAQNQETDTKKETYSSIDNSSQPKKDPEHKHKYSKTVTDATCTEKGYTIYKCSCGDTYKADYVSAKGHTEVVDEAVAATTTSTGLTEGKHCSVCGEILIEQQVVDKIIDYFYTKDIKIDWNYKTGVTYKGGEIACDYQIVSASCVAKKEYYITGSDCSFTLKVRVKCKTGMRYMKVPYIIKDSSGNVIKQDYILDKYSDTGAYTKGVDYTISTFVLFPRIADTYTITLGDF